jgi:hypothetical protein
MIYRLFVLSIFILSVNVGAQTADDYYHDAAFLYIQSKNADARLKVDAGLRVFPGDEKLLMLKERLEEQQESKQDQQNDQDENQDDQDKQDNQENQDQKGDQESEDKKEKEEDKETKNDEDAKDKQDSSDTPEPDPEKEGDQEQDEAEMESPDTDKEGLELTPQQAQEMLRNYSEQDREMRKWKPAKGARPPAKDW